MTEWGVFGVIVALVGLFLAVGAPVLTLNSSITKLNVRLDHMEQQARATEKELDKQKEAAKDSHRRIWQHNDEQDSVLNDHETRITILEKR